MRAFRDPSVPHPQETISPLRDARTIEDELILADLGVAERRLERLEKDLKKDAVPDLEKEQAVLVRCKAALEAGKPLRTLGLAGDDARRLRGFQFLSAKPLLLVLNLDEADVRKTEDAASAFGLTELLAETHAAAVGVCAKIELEIAQLDPADAAAFMADLGLPRVGARSRDSRRYDLLGYISFFTVGEDECRAWSIPRDTPAQEAAGAIHSRHPARLHPRRGRAVRSAARARLARRLPRPRRAAARGQGVPRRRRRRHQLPPRHVTVIGCGPAQPAIA